MLIFIIKTKYKYIYKYYILHCYNLWHFFLIKNLVVFPELFFKYQIIDSQLQFLIIKISYPIKILFLNN